MNVGHYDKAIGILERLIKMEPGQFRNFAQLGLAYAAVGRNDEAVIMFHKSVELEPKFQSQADSYIQQIQVGKMRVK